METDGIHLREMELACSSTESNVHSEHLRWCAQCRNLAAEYRWLDGQLTDMLASASEAVPVTRPKWRAVKRRMIAGRQRRVAGWRVSAVASVALAVCMLLSISSIVGATVAVQLSSPEAVMTPADAVTIVVSEDPVTSSATSTPIASYGGIETPSTPALAPIPTPPTSDA
jgi:predicted anti-sigma-YlaC factor YlaD